jgi:hypothetical protein
MFIQDSNEVYFQNEVSNMNDNNYVDVCDSRVAFPSTILEHQCESTDIVSNDYFFLRLPICYIDTVFDDGSENIYETVHFSEISNSFYHISGSTIKSA